MKTLGDIIEQAKSGGDPTQEECYWAMLALDALLTFESSSTRRIYSDHQEGKKLDYRIKFSAEESFRRIKKALETEPDKWVGESNNPKNPDMQKRRAISVKIYEKAMQKAGINA